MPKLPAIFQPMPWYAQVGLLVLGVAGSIVMEYIQLERERNASSDETDDSEQTVEPERKARRRAR